MSLFFQLSAQARDIEEIKKSKFLRVGIRDKEILYRPQGPKQLHTILAEKFAEYLGKRLKTPLSLEFVIAADLSTYWKNEAGEVKQGSTYTPRFFSKVDLFADILTMNDWREKLASPVVVLPVKEAFLCNFAASGRITPFDARKYNIRILTTQNSSFHTILKDEGFTEKEITFVKDDGNLIGAVENVSEKACTLIDSDTAIFRAKGTRLVFASPLRDKTQNLAWWTAKKDTHLNKHLHDFWKEFLDSQEWKTLFKETYGVEYAHYIKILGEL
jgi:hypothetical protein